VCLEHAPLHAPATLIDPKLLAKPINFMRVRLDDRDKTECGCHVYRRRGHRSARQ
jgi:hypothetical protein